VSFFTFRSFDQARQGTTLITSLQNKQRQPLSVHLSKSNMSQTALPMWLTIISGNCLSEMMTLKSNFARG
jgi:hypothetical protein